MYAIAQIIETTTGKKGNLHARLLTGNHEDAVWVVFDRGKVQVKVGEFHLVRYAEEDQFVHPVSLEDVERALNTQKSILLFVEIYRKMKLESFGSAWNYACENEAEINNIIEQNSITFSPSKEI